MDRTRASGARDRGSIPFEGAIFYFMLWRNLILAFLFSGLTILFFWYQNNRLSVSLYQVGEAKQKEFPAFTVVQLSDLHNKSFGKNSQRLLERIKEINPDLVVVTGDLIDSHRSGMSSAISLMEALTKERPVYYVSGNHERWSGFYQVLEARLRQSGVTILSDKKTLITNTQGQEFILLGLADPDFSGKEQWRKNLNDLAASAQPYFSVLLSHRPERFNDYREAGINVVMTGHAHGGQWRLPYLGGLVAPDQGFFPRYDAGIYQQDKTQMIVSRGLGNSIVPLRLFNPPDVVVLEIYLP